MGTRVRITARSFPTPDLVKTTCNPAQWDQLDGFAAVNADAANEALDLLDDRLATASTFDERVAAFEEAYRHLVELRYRMAAEAGWTRPSSSPEAIRTPIGDRSMLYRLTPSVAGREPGSPAYRTLTERERVALDRFPGSADRVQNRVTLPDGRTVDGNLLMRIGELPVQSADVIGPSTRELAAAAVVADPEEVVTVTATEEDRAVLRRAAFEQLAALETRRAETGHLDADDPESRRAFTDAAYFLIQGPEFERGTDAVTRTLLAAGHTRLFDVAPVIPEGIDLDGMVGGQGGFHQAMDHQLRTVGDQGTTTAPPSGMGERAGGVRRAARLGAAGIRR